MYWIKAKMLLLSSLSICFLAGLSSVTGHVRLMYPEARKYQIDSLSNRYPALGLCGMPRNLSSVTNLQAGSTFNVTWNVGSPHTGGLRVELLDKNYNLITLLAPQGGGEHDYFGDNPVPTDQLVTLPKDITCQDCVIRLGKLGKTWAPPEPEFQMESCADVNVVNEDIPSQCSGRGKWTGSTCECQKPFAGNVCQFADECTDDKDCHGHHGHGKCVDTQAQSYPKMQCYCEYGWHGLNCAIESSVKTPEFNPDKYMKRSAKFTNFTVYWRILADIGEIEVVIVAQAKSWVAVGWRASETNSSCKAFPNIPSETYTTVTSDGQNVDTVLNFMDRSGKFFTDPLHPMACNDITYVATRGKLSRFQDTYTRDHASPRPDSVFGGKDDLTAAVAFEDPITNTVTALFRKKLKATELSDQSISDGSMHLIWAKGQEPYDPAKGVPNIDAQNTITQVKDKNYNDVLLKQFFRKGELNTHAHDAKNRGVWEVNMKTGI